LVYERENIYGLARRFGYFEFLRQYVRFEVDSNLEGNLVDLKLIVDNPENKVEHPVFYVDSSFIEVKRSDGTTSDNPRRDTLDRSMNFIDYTRKFKAKPLDRYIFLKEDDLYNVDFENLTYDRLYELNTF